MPLLRVQPDDAAAIAASVAITEAARAVDDPGAPPALAEIFRRWVRYGWDLHPEEFYLYVPEGEREPVGTLEVDLPFRDNRHLVWTSVVVHPDRRREGHGSAMLAETLRRTREAGRTTIWVGGPADDPAVDGFLTGHGFHRASRDARRKQRLAEVDRDEVARLRRLAEEAAADYTLTRLTPPLDDALLAEVAAVAESINDAPMGDLTWEPEVYDAALMQDQEDARVGRGEQLYRVIARHRVTGELGGHTLVLTNPLRPYRGVQCDTAVARGHRGHRLGLLLKIEMMDWLAEVEPQLDYLETFNQADNEHMIAVNEALGYRLDRMFAMYELTVPALQSPAEPVAAGLAGSRA